MKNQWKKMLGLSLAMAMTVSAFAGCGKQETTKTSEQPSKSSEQVSASSEEKTPAVSQSAEPETPEKFDDVVLKCVFQGGDGVKIAERIDMINDILSEKLGVTLDIEFFNSANYDLQLASGEELDLVVAGTSTGYVQKAMSGAFAEITDEMLQKYAPELWEDNITSTEASKIQGKRYGVTNKPYALPKYIAYRGDLADKYGIGYIDTPEELEEYLFAIAENEPEMIGWDLKSRNAYYLSNIYFPQLDWITIGAVGFSSVYYIDKNDPEYKVFLAAERPEYLEYVERMHTWYEKGVIPKNVLSSTANDLESFKAGRSALGFLSSDNAAHMLNAELQADERKDWNVQYTTYYFDETVYTASILNTITAISSNSKNVEACVAVLGEMYRNEDLYRLCYLGVEGVNYLVDEEAKTYEMIEKGDEGWLSVYGPNKTFNLKTYVEFPGSEELVPKVESWITESPLSNMTIDTEVDGLRELTVAMSEVNSQYTVPNMLGVFEGTAEEAVAAELAALKKAGAEEYIAALQKQVDEYVSYLSK